MSEQHLAQLEKGGLSSGEAQIYLALVRNGGPMGASAIVTATGVPRGSVYPTLTRLTEMGLVEAEAGYGGRFSAIPAERALPSLILREREELSQREQILDGLVKELKSVAPPATSDLDAEIIQVLRDPRVIAERFERLQLEVERQIDIFVKYPIFNPRQSNPTEDKVLKKGVRARGLYERAIIDAPEIKPHLSKWIASGEEVRVHDGELPHKLAIFDQQDILLPLVTPGRPTRTLFIRHPQLATSLTLLFESFWNDAQPIVLKRQKRTTTRKKSVVGVADPGSSNAIRARASATSATGHKNRRHGDNPAETSQAGSNGRKQS